MIEEMSGTFPQDANLAARTDSCSHSRIVDDVLNAQGIKTGQLICLECRAVLPDPAAHRPDH